MTHDKIKNVTQKIWTFLNSNFGMFIIGTVLVGFITTRVSNNIQEKQASIENRKQVIRYLTELDYRMGNILVARYNWFTLEDEEKAEHLRNRQMNLDEFTKWDEEDNRIRSTYRAKYDSMNKSYRAIFTGSAPYIPTEKLFEQQNMVSIISWFRFSLDKSINIENELKSITLISSSIPSTDETFSNAVEKIHKLSANIRGYLDAEN